MLIFGFIHFRTSKNKLNFQPKDKVCCTKNGYVRDHEKKQERTSFDTARAVQDSARSSHDDAGHQSQNEQMKEKKERLCNGEIFFIKDVLMFYLAIYICFCLIISKFWLEK